MSTTRIPTLFVGATGYIGGGLLSRLSGSQPFTDKLDITALVRSPEKAKRLTTEFKVKTAIGSIQDLDKLEQLAEQAHLVISIANADDVPMIEALLRGLKKRNDKLHDRPVFLHTSGTAILVDQHMLGDRTSPNVYSDLDVEKLAAIPPQAWHRPVDLALLDADKAGYINSVLVIPPTIYGEPTGAIVDAGLANKHSIQIPTLIRSAIERKRVALIGEGKGIWDHVNVNDLVDLFALLIENLLTSPEKVAHGAEGYYFVENGEYLQYNLITELGKILYSLGVVSSAEPQRFVTEEEVVAGALKERMVAMGTNARSHADRSRLLGWKPKFTNANFWASIKPEAEAIVKELRA